MYIRMSEKRRMYVHMILCTSVYGYECMYVCMFIGLCSRRSDRSELVGNVCMCLMYIVKGVWGFNPRMRANLVFILLTLLMARDGGDRTGVPTRPPPSLSPDL